MTEDRAPQIPVTSHTGWLSLPCPRQFNWVWMGYSKCQESTRQRLVCAQVPWGPAIQKIRPSELPLFSECGYIRTTLRHHSGRRKLLFSCLAVSSVRAGAQTLLDCFQLDFLMMWICKVQKQIQITLNSSLLESYYQDFGLFHSGDINRTWSYMRS